MLNAYLYFCVHSCVSKEKNKVYICPLSEEKVRS